jgi:hypothetical protein
MKAGKRQQRSSRKRQPLFRAPADESGEWHNTSANCQEDELQVIVNNSKGKEKEVNFLIVNRGKCAVRIGTTATREGGTTDADSQKIPGGSKERVAITIPAGAFLKATCVDHNENGCDWTISDLRM